MTFETVEPLQNAKNTSKKSTTSSNLQAVYIAQNLTTTYVSTKNSLFLTKTLQNTYPMFWDLRGWDTWVQGSED